MHSSEIHLSQENDKQYSVLDKMQRKFFLRCLIPVSVFLIKEQFVIMSNETQEKTQFRLKLQIHG